MRKWRMSSMTEEEARRIVADFNNTEDATVRSIAKTHNSSKSTVHKILTVYLRNPTSDKKLEKNRKERHIRGGMATRRKYLEIRLNKGEKI